MLKRAVLNLDRFSDSLEDEIRTEELLEKELLVASQIAEAHK